YAAGESITELAARHGVPRTTLGRWLAEAGVQKRSRSETVSKAWSAGRAPNVAAGWNRGMVTDPGAKRRKAVAAEQSLRYSGRHEAEIADLLARAGFAGTRQKAV